MHGKNSTNIVEASRFDLLTKGILGPQHHQHSDTLVEVKTSGKFGLELVS